MIQRELEMNILKLANKLLQLKPPPMIALAQKAFIGGDEASENNLNKKQKNKTRLMSSNLMANSIVGIPMWCIANTRPRPKVSFATEPAFCTARLAKVSSRHFSATDWVSHEMAMAAI